MQMFADDAKLFHNIVEEQHCAELQNDLKKTTKMV